ncbi:hypothetical protein HYC85_019463 [Camellia sinensis]|uniref:S-protein homolog n=1 Tax=Camellia sinensis TaxID=4442 RepID=A0A7J7GPH8_CAMSI|nr:hypothetical protein HYC85_019463 [Camellia sinensis]
MKTLTIFLLILSLVVPYIVFMSLKQPSYLSGRRYDVYVINGFKNNSSLPLVIWCASGEDDMGGRALQEGDDFSWSLKTKLWGTTLFSCTMKWDRLRKRFSAFQVQRDSHRCAPLRKCFWLVKEDGFYFSNDGLNYKKDFSWFS